MRMNTYIIEANPGLQEKAEQFLGARSACEQTSDSEDDAVFSRTGIEMSRSYLALAQSLGMGAGFFPTDDRSNASAMSVRDLRGEIVIRVPERIDLGNVSGLTLIRPDDYTNMVQNANAALRSAVDVDGRSGVPAAVAMRPR